MRLLSQNRPISILLSLNQQSSSNHSPGILTTMTSRSRISARMTSFIKVPVVFSPHIYGWSAARAISTLTEKWAWCLKCRERSKKLISKTSKRLSMQSLSIKSTTNTFTISSGSRGSTEYTTFIDAVRIGH